MLIFWGLSSSSLSVLPPRLHDLGQHAAGGGGVQEGDSRAADAGARGLVDQAQAGGRAGRERSSTDATR